MWMWPLAYGGPSWSTKSWPPCAGVLRDEPLEDLLLLPLLRISGSRWGRLAFIGKSVFGRLTVSLYSTSALVAFGGTGFYQRGPVRATNGSARPGLRPPAIAASGRSRLRVRGADAAPRKAPACAAHAAAPASSAGGRADPRHPVPQPPAPLDAPAGRGDASAGPPRLGPRHAPLQHGAGARAPRACSTAARRSGLGVDVVIPRIGASITGYGLAVVNQFDMMGVPVLAAADPHRPLPRQAARAAAPLPLRPRHPAHGDVPLPRRGAAGGGARWAACPASSSSSRAPRAWA